MKRIKKLAIKIHVLESK